MPNVPIPPIMLLKKPRDGLRDFCQECSDWVAFNSAGTEFCNSDTKVGRRVSTALAWCRGNPQHHFKFDASFESCTWRVSCGCLGLGRSVTIFNWRLYGAILGLRLAPSDEAGTISHILCHFSSSRKALFNNAHLVEIGFHKPPIGTSAGYCYRIGCLSHPFLPRPRVRRPAWLTVREETIMHAGARMLQRTPFLESI